MVSQQIRKDFVKEFLQVPLTVHLYKVETAIWILMCDDFTKNLNIHRFCNERDGGHACIQLLDLHMSCSFFLRSFRSQSCLTARFWILALDKT